MNYKVLIISVVFAYIQIGYGMIKILKNGRRSEQPMIIFSSNIILKFLFALRWPIIYSYEEETMYKKRNIFKIYAIVKTFFTLLIYSSLFFIVFTLAQSLNNQIISLLVYFFGLMISYYFAPLVYIFVANLLITPILLLLSILDNK